MKTLLKSIGLLLFILQLSHCSSKKESQWAEDFKFQPVQTRPGLEVNYTDDTRTAFNILAEKYRLVGQLRQPHLLTDDKGQEWLSMQLTTKAGEVFSTTFSAEKSRINLYRRGPYFCEIHWFDIQLANEKGEILPLKGDLALYSYPEKLLAEITWHATGDFNGGTLQVKGIAPMAWECPQIKSGEKRSFAFPLFGEEEPLSNSAFSMLEGKVPLRYYPRKGYYVIGTETSNSFQKQFYDFPNKYETASFSLKNDGKPRKIYICHESVVGGAIVEGGAVLDKDGHSMPLVIQVSKNFGGEKEEKFYNPLDTAFSETFFPLYLEAEEEVTLTSLHLYQNWGNHMTKHWSSLGAWMDYFHSSTGVTETTCYVPFKFAGIGGVSIADFRAMSQDTFWKGQPQHDNIAGHSFLSFFDGKKWQHTKYQSTIYRSTGPNWYDVQMNYISADGSIKITADIWETPQVDELRSFFNVKYEVLKPLTIEDAQANFRLLSVTSSIQRLRYNRFAASGIEDMEIDFANAPFPIKGIKLPPENAFIAVYGDTTLNRGSNAVIIRKFTGPNKIGPAASVQTGNYKNRFVHDNDPDTRMLLVPDVEKLVLKPGDVFEVNGYWLPYGERDNASTPRQETETYALDAPQVTDIAKGEIISHLPIKIKAQNNEAQFTLKGGKDLVPVVISGLTDWRFPRIWKKENDQWRLLSHARNSDHDGYQVYSEPGGTFGAVFLVHSNSVEQLLKVRVGTAVVEEQKIEITIKKTENGLAHLLLLGADTNGSNPALAFPSHANQAGFEWKKSEGNSLWFESDEGKWKRGGRVNPNQTAIDLEYWWQNIEEGNIHAEPEFSLHIKNTAFDDPDNERTFILTNSGWESINTTSESISKAIATKSKDGKRIICLVWNNASQVFKKEQEIGVSLKSIEIPLHKRYHVRGKLYLISGELDVLEDRIRKEMNL